MREFPASQFIVSVLLQLEQVIEVQVVLPDHEPVPPAPKYCPHVPLVARPLDTVALARRAGERPSCTKAARGGRAGDDRKKIIAGDSRS